jgi:hypothetical protein
MADFTHEEFAAILRTCAALRIHAAADFLRPFIARRLEAAGRRRLADRVRGLGTRVLERLCRHIAESQGQEPRRRATCTPSPLSSAPNSPGPAGSTLPGASGPGAEAPMPVNTAAVPELQAVAFGGRHYVPVPWERAEGARERLRSVGIPCTLCLDPLGRVAHLELGRGVEPRRALAALREPRGAP